MSAADVREVIAQCSPEQARRITEQIRTAVAATWELIAQAYESLAWAALGYGSWDDYCTREFGDARLKLPREKRQEVVMSLSDAGLSTRAIAAATGDSKDTVARALSGVSFETPDELSGYSTQESRTVQGRDGKIYPARPTTEPAKPKRGPLADQAQSAGWDLRKSIERIERIVADDRFSANKEQVAAHLRGHLTHVVQVCQDLLDDFPTDHQEAR